VEVVDVEVPVIVVLVDVVLELVEVPVPQAISSIGARLGKGIK